MKKVLFSSKEIEVLKKAIQGLNDDEIAKKLNLSKHTISTHKKNMRRKLNSKNLYRVIAFAFRKNLIR